SGSGLVLAPFRGIRYARDRVSGIANVTSPPYDVISGGILENLRAADPHNVVRLILPGEDAAASQAAASLLREWLSAGVLIRDRMPALYLYEQADEASSWLQRGIISLVRLGSPETAGILPHERVTPGPGGRPEDADGGDQGQPGADLPHLRRRGHRYGGRRGRAHGHRDHRPCRGRAHPDRVDHDRGRSEPPAVAARPSRRAGHHLGRPGRAPRPDR